MAKNSGSGQWFQRIGLGLLLLSPSVNAQVYKWQDEKGNWHFSDQKPASGSVETVTGLPTSSRPAATTSQNEALSSDLETQLQERFQPQPGIESSTLAVVGIRTSLGQGSGFFISNDGLIVTNKHVIRPTMTEDWQESQAQAEQASQRLADYQRELELERKRLKEYEQQLRDYREELERYSPEGVGQRLRWQEYREHEENHQNRLRRLNEAEKEYQDQKRRFESEQSDFRFNSSLAGAAQRFEITLKDNTTATAELLKISEKHDLALLRLKGTRTPSLSMGNSKVVRQGNAVFAIGSPLGMRDSLTSGIIARLQSDYLVTDAQILPGNSGGPLLNESAEVVGVNTLKFARGEATSSGFGMAIRIETVQEEFAEFLQP